MKAVLRRYALVYVSGAGMGHIHGPLCRITLTREQDFWAISWERKSLARQMAAALLKAERERRQLCRGKGCCDQRQGGKRHGGDWTVQKRKKSQPCCRWLSQGSSSCWWTWSTQDSLTSQTTQGSGFPVLYPTFVWFAVKRNSVLIEKLLGTKYLKVLTYLMQHGHRKTV